MDVSTGRLGSFDELIGEGSNPKDIIAIQRAMATQQQEVEKFVALNDSKSPLGKLRQSHDPKTKNQLKKARQNIRKGRNSGRKKKQTC